MDRSSGTRQWSTSGGERASGRPTSGLVALLVLVAAACSSGSTSEPSPSPRAHGDRSGTAPPAPAVWPEPAGPLAELRWPAGSVGPGVLLHDDGTRLLSVPLNGKPTVLWRHPFAKVYEIASAPDGDRLAFTVKLPVDSSRDPSFILYLLASDGAVRTVDVVHDFGHIATPAFLRAPTEPHGTIRLYWVRGADRVDPATGRLDGQIMVLGPNGPEHVTAPARYLEAPFAVFGYPGAATFSLMLFRTNDVPTRFEVLVNRDRYGNAADASLTLWADNEPRIGTDLSSVAWLSPTQYVVPVAKDDYPRDYRLRLFVFGCEWAGSYEVYRGDGIDWGYAENPWPILPGGEGRVLVLGASDMHRIRAKEVSEIPWLSVDVETGEITPTDAMWSGGPGWWTFVQPDLGPGIPLKEAQFPDCSNWEWIYP